MGWRTRISALPIRDLRQIVYLLPMWGGIWSSVVVLWRRLICPQNGSLRMFWYRDLNSSHFFPRFGALELEVNKTPDISATFIGSYKKFCKRKRMSVCPARKRKPRVLSVSYGLNRFNWCNRWRTTLLQSCAKISSTRLLYSTNFLSLRKKVWCHTINCHVNYSDWSIFHLSNLPSKKAPPWLKIQQRYCRKIQHEEAGRPEYNKTTGIYFQKFPVGPDRSQCTSPMPGGLTAWSFK